MLFGQHIIADERGIPAYPGKFNVDSPYQFGLELWKATQLFDDRQEHGAHFKANLPPHIPLPNILIEGRDRQSLYLTNEARNYRGRMPWGEIAEILVDDVRGVTLGEMTRRVSAILTPKYQARRELNKQEELAKRASKVSTELEENRSGDRQSPEVTHDQPHSAEGTTVSLIGANTPALAISPLDASTASADGNKRPSTPKAGLIPSSASPPTAAGAANKVPDAIKNKTTRHNSGPMPPPAMPTEVTSHDSLTPTALEPPRTSLKCNRNSPDVAGQPAGIGQARETDEDGEDDVVFVGRKKKVVKVTNDSSGDQGRGAPETRRKPKRGLGSWW